MMVSNMVNEQLHAPLLATDQMIQFAVDHQNVNVDPVVARQMHLSTVDTISDLINRPRRLFLGQYDGTFSQEEVLIDFDGKWVDCTAVIAQPVYCKPIPNS